jgi:hypothetical protein
LALHDPVEHMKCFANLRMFAGLINRRLVFSCHPFFVVCQKGVAAAFTSFEAAHVFLNGQGFRAGFIYRHNGTDWDKVEFKTLAERPLMSLSGDSSAES